jgi:DNA-binding XRE family transcriptional regulator
MPNAPIIIDEIASINSNDVFKVNQMRKKLGITQTFLASCAGIPYSSFNKMINESEWIPERYVEPLTNALIGLYYVHEGRKVLPVKNGRKDDGKETRYEKVIAFLEEVGNPTVGVKSALHWNQEEMFTHILDQWRNRADELLLELIESED